jgi:uncharacterized protein YbjT (DUF2867 family)
MLMKSGIAYTIIGASHLMSNPVLYQVKNPHAVGDTVKLYGSSGGKVVNYVSPNDVAEVAVRALIAPHDHVDKIYELTGRISITEDEVARLLGKFMSKGVEYVEQPIETFEQEEKQSGTPSWLLHDIVSLEKIKALGHEGYTQFISSDFETICNHKPESFAEYLANVDAMSPREKALAA